MSKAQNLLPRELTNKSVREVIMSIVEQLTKQEGLRYVNDSMPGISRQKRGNSFWYFDPHGNRITSASELARIKALVIPPAYRDVWICQHPNGHLQATGIDEKGRKQYRYHDRWRAVRDENKFEHILSFATKLPALRRQIAKHFSLPGLPEEKVLATVIHLLDQTLIRVGNETYARENHSFGLTTLRKNHVVVQGSTVRFRFRGKSGKQWNLSIQDRRIAAVVKRCTDLPGFELFQYLDANGQHRSIDSGRVNGYLKRISGEDFTAKDFRTWAATVLAASVLSGLAPDSKTQLRKNLVLGIKQVAAQLGNTPAICRKCYVHPEILSAYQACELAKLKLLRISQKIRRHYRELSSDELVVLLFLQKRLGVDFKRL